MTSRVVYMSVKGGKTKELLFFRTIEVDLDLINGGISILC